MKCTGRRGAIRQRGSFLRRSTLGEGGQTLSRGALGCNVSCREAQVTQVRRRRGEGPFSFLARSLRKGSGDQLQCAAVQRSQLPRCRRGPLSLGAVVERTGKWTMTMHAPDLVAKLGPLSGGRLLM
jgi:hypothetical protein